MPSPLYDNKYLADAEAKRKLGVLPEKSLLSGSVEPYVQPQSVEDILAQAHQTLNDTAPLDRLAKMSSQAPVVDAAATAHPYREFAKGAAEAVPGVLDVAALPASFYPPTATAANAWLGARGAQQLAQGGIQGLKEHPIRSAMDAGMVGLGASGLMRGLGEAAEVGRPYIKVAQGAASQRGVAPATAAASKVGSSLEGLQNARPKSGIGHYDLMDEFLNSQGPKQSFHQPGVGQMEMDANGSHKLVSDMFAGDRNVPPSSDLIDSVYPPAERGLAGLKGELAAQSAADRQAASNASEVDLTDQLNSLKQSAAPTPRFGLGSVQQAGAKPANLLHDPSYSTQELVKELAKATDPADKAYLQRAITQRRVVARKAGNVVAGAK